MKQKYVMANLVYGQLYPQLWCENHLKSLLDKTNLPALREHYDLEYVIFTDDQTMLQISRHPHFMALSAICAINVIKIGWPPDVDQFGNRYALLTQMFHAVLKEVLEGDEARRNAWLSLWVADLVFAKHSLPTMLAHLERGHDAVFNVPIRSAFDSLQPVLAKLPGAPSDLELFEMAYGALHHLWVASIWDSPTFSKFPYSMLWDSGTGLVAHNFGVTPIIFKPNAEMAKVQGVIDADVPAYCKNPYWATDWTDAAVAGVEPLSNGHYPPFLHHRASEPFVVDWALSGTHPSQVHNLDKPLFYPSRSRFNNPQLAARAAGIAKDIQNRILEQQREAATPDNLPAGRAP